VAARADHKGEQSWLQSEEGQIKFMQGVTRLIHNEDRSEDNLIVSLLQESLALHERLDEHERIGDVLNSLGTLHSKAGRLTEAEATFMRSLKLREQHIELLDGKIAFAQACVSLGNFLAEQPGRVDEALDYLRNALRCYREALGREHPKARACQCCREQSACELTRPALLAGCARARGDCEGADEAGAARRSAGPHRPGDLHQGEAGGEDEQGEHAQFGAAHQAAGGAG
jgi:tetratricopeptide (TPR) repeat protein